MKPITSFLAVAAAFSRVGAATSSEFVSPASLGLVPQTGADGSARFQKVPRIENGAKWDEWWSVKSGPRRRGDVAAGGTPLDLAGDAKFRLAHPLEDGCSFAVGDVTFTVSDTPTEQRIVNVDAFKGVLKSAECDGNDVVVNFNTDVMFQYALANWDWVNVDGSDHRIIALMDAADFPTCAPIDVDGDGKVDDIIPFEVDHTVPDEEVRSIRLHGKRLAMSKIDMDMSVDVHVEEDESCSAHGHAKRSIEPRGNSDDKDKKKEKKGNGWTRFWGKFGDGIKKIWHNITDAVSNWFQGNRDDFLDDLVHKGLKVPFTVPMSGEIANDDDSGDYEMHAECVDCGVSGVFRLHTEVQGINPWKMLKEKSAKPSITMNVSLEEEAKAEGIFRVGGHGDVPKSLAYQKAFKSWYIPGTHFSIANIFAMKGIFSADLGMSIRAWEVSANEENGAVVQLGSKYRIPAGAHAAFAAEKDKPRRDDVSPKEMWTPKFRQSPSYVSDPSANANVDFYTNFGLGAELELLGMKGEEAGVQFQMPMYRGTVDPVSSTPAESCQRDETFKTLSEEEQNERVRVSGSVGVKIVAYYGRHEVDAATAGEETALEEEEEEEEEEEYDGAKKHLPGFEWDDEKDNPAHKAPKVNDAEAPPTKLTKIPVSKLGLVIPLYEYTHELSRDCVKASIETFAGVMNETEIVEMAGGRVEVEEETSTISSADASASTSSSSPNEEASFSTASAATTSSASSSSAAATDPTESSAATSPAASASLVPKDGKRDMSFGTRQ
ncbi:hypothetical protein MKZ38_002117 [Zalerion maritima]|uniref:Uncharacterized protein n=1 Tax=Zalerion maritima TaxID=339359 RepID=A0AAD5WTC8_9PEZI|nr:hypothetical protein MKZ38_002117 [Zalerion maritima]